MNKEFQELIGFLRRIYLFSCLETEELAKIIPYLKTISFAKGSFIYKIGEQPDGLYLVKSGIVAMHPRVEEEFDLHYLGRGNYFGETALFGEKTRENNVQAATYIEVFFFKKEDFQRLLDSDARLTTNSFLSLGRRVLQTAPKYPQKPPAEMIVVYPHLEKEAQHFFALHLGPSLVEQTRQKTLLVDCDCTAKKYAQYLNLSPILSTEQMFHVEDLYNPVILGRITNRHSSGLEVISLPPNFFQGKLLAGLSPFLSMLRDYYYRTIFCLSSRFDPTTKLILESADKVLFLFAPSFLIEGNTPQQRYQRLIQSVPVSKVKSVLWAEDTAKLNLLSEDREFLGKIDFVFNERKKLLETFPQKGLFEKNILSAAFQKNIGRLSRQLAKLQIGLALGSGMAYGYTAIGLLKVLEKENIPIDLIGGTSIGALIGSFYAAGKSIDELEEIAKSITKQWLIRNFLTDLSISRSGLFGGQKILKFLYSILGDREFSQLSLPFFCIATDILTGEAVVLDKGKVYQAVRASISLPGIFKPYYHQDKYFVDGGLIEPVPAQKLKEAGADIVLSLNLISRSLAHKKFLLSLVPNKSKLSNGMPNILEVIMKSIYIMEYEISTAKAEQGEVVFSPDVSNFNSLELHRAPELIKIGEETAAGQIDQIKKLLPFFNPPK
ncbi:MAG: patatin-like phospholipase family protein [Elusimicrobiota bacterium]